MLKCEVSVPHLLLLLGALGKALLWSVASCPPSYEGMSYQHIAYCILYINELVTIKFHFRKKKKDNKLYLCHLLIVLSLDTVVFPPDSSDKFIFQL